MIRLFCLGIFLLEFVAIQSDKGNGFNASNKCFIFITLDSKVVWSSISLFSYNKY